MMAGVRTDDRVGVALVWCDKATRATFETTHQGS